MSESATAKAIEIINAMPAEERAKLRHTVGVLFCFLPDQKLSDPEKDAAADLFEAAGFEPWALLPRDEIGAALGLEEPALPDWAVPGAEIFQPGRGARGLWLKIRSIEGSTVTFENEGGSMPAGVLARHQHRAPLAA